MLRPTCLRFAAHVNAVEVPRENDAELPPPEEQSRRTKVAGAGIRNLR